VFRHHSDQNEHSFSNVPLGGGEVITEQPTMQGGGGSFGSQISTGIPNNFGGGGGGGGRPPPLPPMMSPQLSQGIPLPGFDILDRIPVFKIHNTGKKTKLNY
jgi:hypothetical protein